MATHGSSGNRSLADRLSGNSERPRDPLWSRQRPLDPADYAAVSASSLAGRAGRTQPRTARSRSSPEPLDSDSDGEQTLASLVGGVRSARGRRRSEDARATADADPQDDVSSSLSQLRASGSGASYEEKLSRFARRGPRAVSPGPPASAGHLVRMVQSDALDALTPPSSQPTSPGLPPTTPPRGRSTSHPTSPTGSAAMSASTSGLPLRSASAFVVPAAEADLYEDRPLYTAQTTLVSQQASAGFPTTGSSAWGGAANDDDNYSLGDLLADVDLPVATTSGFAAANSAPSGFAAANSARSSDEFAASTGIVRPVPNLVRTEPTPGFVAPNLTAGPVVAAPFGGAPKFAGDGFSPIDAVDDCAASFDAEAADECVGMLPLASRAPALRPVDQLRAPAMRPADSRRQPAGPPRSTAPDDEPDAAGPDAQASWASQSPIASATARSVADVPRSASAAFSAGGVRDSRVVRASSSFPTAASASAAAALRAPSSSPALVAPQRTGSPASSASPPVAPAAARARVSRPPPPSQEQGPYADDDADDDNAWRLPPNEEEDLQSSRLLLPSQPTHATQRLPQTMSAPSSAARDAPPSWRGTGFDAGFESDVDPGADGSDSQSELDPVAVGPPAKSWSRFGFDVQAPLEPVLEDVKKEKIAIGPIMPMPPTAKMLDPLMPNANDSPDTAMMIAHLMYLRERRGSALLPGSNFRPAPKTSRKAKAAAPVKRERPSPQPPTPAGRPPGADRPPALVPVSPVQQGLQAASAANGARASPSGRSPRPPPPPVPATVWDVDQSQQPAPAAAAAVSRPPSATGRRMDEPTTDTRERVASKPPRGPADATEKDAASGAQNKDSAKSKDKRKSPVAPTRPDTPDSEASLDDDAPLAKLRRTSASRTRVSPVAPSPAAASDMDDFVSDASPSVPVEDSAATEPKQKKRKSSGRAESESAEAEREVPLIDCFVDSSASRARLLALSEALATAYRVVVGCVYANGATNFRAAPKARRKRGIPKEDGPAAAPAVVGLAFYLPDRPAQDAAYLLPLPGAAGVFKTKESVDRERAREAGSVDIRTMLTGPGGPEAPPSEAELIAGCRNALRSVRCACTAFNVQPLLHWVYQGEHARWWDLGLASQLRDPLVASWLIDPDVNRNATQKDVDFAELAAYYHVAGGAETSDASAESTVMPASELLGDMRRCQALMDALAAQLVDRGLDQPFRTQEMQLLPVLAGMEVLGVGFDRQMLSSLSRDMQLRSDELAAEAHRLAGQSFNLASPMQVSKVLEELGLLEHNWSPSKKHSTTNEETLRALQHPLGNIILDYRRYQKLLSTYVEGLIIHAVEHPAKDGAASTFRIHSTFQLTDIATGRIQSIEPNLQNLPKEEDRLEKPGSHQEYSLHIRDAVCARDGFVLISADYSQMEMRLLAHFCDEDALIRHFQLNAGEDLFRFLASHWLGKPIDGVTAQDRTLAKTLTYACVYGSGAKRLEKEMKIPEAEVNRLMRSFFSRFPRIKQFKDQTIASTRRQGYVSTFSHRRRYLPDINSTNGEKRSYAERQAVNSVIQGTGADLVKMAILDVAHEMQQRKLCVSGGGLMLVIHDELLFEVPEAEERDMVGLITETMERVADLKIPLKVSVKCGKRWGSLVPTPSAANSEV
eukprot:TRINITY_DN2939_c0_g3_i1.p1 TRINITY_DN2939_c0_g3~~TRINITY_DN2939_c0_g3_i1.p1  ORF type:complete len:1637 (-),score=474.04 TRINITY_DN2939_c0_g3_i1:991-5901(-)